MDREDAAIIRAERDSDPVRFRDYDPNNSFDAEHARFSTERSYSAQSPRTRNPPDVQSPIDDEIHEEEPVEEEEREGSVSSSDSEPDEDELRNVVTPYHRASVVSQASTRMEVELMHYLDRHPTAIKRIQEHRLQHSLTVGSTRASGVDVVDLPSFGGNKPYPKPLPDREEYVVEFDGHEDPRHAQNWPTKKKILVGGIVIFDSLAATFASSIFSPAGKFVGEYYHIGDEVVTLATSLFVLGYASGPIIFAPMSELYGRRPPIVLAAFAFGIFNIAVAVSKDVQTLMICRFFAGFCGSAPLAITGAVMADMFDNKYRGLAVSFFGAVIIMGPLMAPFTGGFIAKSYLGWRWVAYIPAFMGFFASLIALFFMEESYGPVILVSKAAELRRLTRNWGIHAKQEEVEVDIRELVVKNVARPLRILFTEPIVLMVTLFMSFLYGLLYLSLTAYGIVFGEIHHMELGVSGLPFFGMVVGVAFGMFVSIWDVPRYAKKLEANNNIPVPEWRMPLVFIGSIIFCAGLFWFGWTGYTASIPWIVPTLAGLFLGYGIYTVFMGCLNYIIDAYLMFAASAIAANTIMRSIFGAVFPLFATYMFNGIGINWGETLLGCMAALFIPMPIIFYFKGKSIRAKSKFAPAQDVEQDRRTRDLESGAGAGQQSANSSSGEIDKDEKDE